MPLRALKNKFGTLLNSGDVVLTEDYVELSPDAQKKSSPKMMVRTFRLEEFESVKDILTSIREGYTICIVNMLPLKDKDSIGLKRAIDKLKKTVDANDGDIAAFGEHWLVVTPTVARVYRASRVAAQEAEEPDADDTGSVQVY